MDVLALCWTFDSRWVFGFNFNVHLIWIPVIIDLLTLIAFAIEPDLPGCCPSSSSQAILAAIMLGEISVMSISYMKTIKQKNRNYENSKQIHNFLFKYHTKKTIWSIVGLFIFTMSFVLLLLQLCQVIVQDCGTEVVVFRTILDLACWLYLLFIIVGSMLCKVWYLIWAWKFPQSYLRYRKVIP